MIGRIEKRHFSPLVEIAEHFAMVGSHDEQRVAILAGVLEEIHDAADMRVDLCCQAQINRPQSLHVGSVFVVQLFASVHELIDGIAFQIRREERMKGGLDFGGSHADRERNVLGAIHGIVRNRRDQRGMRTNVSQMREPALFGANTYFLEEFIRQERGIAVVRFIKRWIVRRGFSLAGRNRNVELRVIGDFVTAPLQVGSPRVTLFKRHLDLFAEARHGSLVGLQGRVGRMHASGVRARIAVAEQHWFVSCLSGFRGQIQEIGTERRGVPDRAVVHRIEAGQDARPGRPARVCHRVVPVEGDRVTFKGIQTRQIDAFRKRSVHAICAQLIDHDKKNVFFVAHARIS